MSTPRARVGPSGWGKPSWERNFYGSGIPKPRRLAHLARLLATVEINATFHGLRSPKDFAHWREQTPDDFVFAVKAVQAVTHDARLRAPGRTVRDFFASGPLLLDGKLGPFLWQIPPSLPFEPRIVEAFLATLPRSFAEVRSLVGSRGDVDPDSVVPVGVDRPLRHSFEARNASFLAPAFAAQLRHYDVAAVVVNKPGQPVIHGLASDFVYARLYADDHFHPDGYDDAAIEEWARRIESWVDGSGAADGRPRDAFVYFENRDDETGWHPPFDAIRLQERLGGRGGDTPGELPTTLW